MAEVRGLTLRAGGRTLVSDLSFTLPEPGITVMIGPSGCGKSSVLKWIAGILPAGIDASGSLDLSGGTAYQPQSDALFPWLSIAENAALGLRVSGLSARQARARVAPLFDRFGLSGTEDLFPSQLSGGMRQRAAFLRTMVQDRRYILLDEPFSALDAVTRLRMQSWLLERLRTDPRGVLLVTHDLQEAAALADQILVLRGGHLHKVPLPPLPRPRSEAALAPLREELKSLLLEE